MSVVSDRGEAPEGWITRPLQARPPPLGRAARGPPSTPGVCARSTPRARIPRARRRRRPPDRHPEDPLSRSSPHAVRLAAAIPVVAALWVSLPLLLAPADGLHADSYRAYDWLEAAKWRWWAVEGLGAEGRLPLWNPYLEGGVPSHAHPSDGSLGPFFATALIFGPLLSMRVDAVLLLILGALGTFFLARRWLDLGPLGAGAAATAFAIAGWLPSRLGVGFYESLFFCVLPAVFALILEARERPALGLAAATLLAAAGVQLQLCLAFALLQLALWTALSGRARELGGRVAAVTGLALGLAAVKLVPVAAFVSSRGGRAERFDHAVGLLDGVLPPLTHLFVHADALGIYDAQGAPATEEYAYGGLAIAVGLLAVAGAVATQRRGLRLAALFGVTALLGWTPGSGLQLSLFPALHLFPVFDAMRDTARYVPFFLVLWTCLLAGLGAEGLAHRGRPGQIVLVLLAVASLPGAAATWALNDGLFTEPTPLSEQRKPGLSHVRLAGQPARAERSVALLNWTGPPSGVGVVYTPEDLPPASPSAVRAMWTLDSEGRRSKASAQPAAWSGDRSGRVEVGVDRLTATLPGRAGERVVFNQNHGPGWRSDAGAVVDVGGLLGVELAVDVEQVELLYRPRPVRWGAAISVLSALSALLGLAVLRRRRR